MSSSRPIRYYLVDAFTERPFAGNPAVVMPLEEWRSDDWLQAVAREMNQSETAFLVRRGDVFELRWMTPTVEVDLCGHATLASAFVVWRQGLWETGREISFSTRSGILRAIPVDERIELDFPLKPEEPVPPPEGLLESLGVAAIYVGHNRMDYLVEVASEAVLRELKPDLTKLARVACRGIIVTARSSQPEYDFVSRFFAPAAGINEDPVTGSSHCCLADFWRKRLGKLEFLAYQASQRGGTLHVRIVGDRVRLGGQAVLVAIGELVA